MSSRFRPFASFSRSVASSSPARFVSSRHVSTSALALLLSIALAVSGCTGKERLAQPLENSAESQNSSTAQQAQAEFDAFCTEVFREEMSATSALDLHYMLLHPEKYGIKNEEAAFGVYSLSEMAQATASARDIKNRLARFSPASLTENQQILYDALDETLNTTLLAEGLELYRQPLSPTIGTQAQLPILLAEYAFHSMEDVEDYLRLLSQTDEYYGQLLAFEKQKADAGLAPSDGTIDGILESCKSYLLNPEENFLTETFDLRLSALEKQHPLTEAEKTVLRARHEAAIRDHFLPAYQSLIDGMTALKGRGLSDGGLCTFRDGKQYYEYLLKSGPGLSYTVPELKQALAARMEADLSALRLLCQENPDLPARQESFRLVEPKEILLDLKQNIQKDFPPVPPCSYEIRYVPESLESILSPAFYLTPPVDAPGQNVIYINNGSADGTLNRYTTLAHEGFPGHLYQNVYSRSHASHPLSALLSVSGASEGWATYAENHACLFDNGLSDGAGTYRALLRSISLCVHGLLDVGIHYDGWTRKEAMAFVQDYFQVDEESFSALWQAIIDNPTNYLEYAGGYTELMEIEAEARKALGEGFSPREFHTLLLDLGPIPFPVIRKYVSLWLAKKGV